MLKLKKLENYLDSKGAIGILLLRIFIGSRLIYGVIDNIVSWDKMIEFSHFLEKSQFPFPLFNAVLSVYLQFIAGILILIGFKIRPAAFTMVINFLVAIIFVHLWFHDSVEGMTPALAMLFGSLALLFTGGDKISIDARIRP